MKLTKPVIDGLRFTGATQESKCVVWDDEVPSFGVRVMPSGVKTFVIQYRHRGRRRYFTLGAYGVLTLTQARDQAKLRLACPSGSRPPGRAPEASPWGDGRRPGEGLYGAPREPEQVVGEGP